MPIPTTTIDSREFRYIALTFDPDGIHYRLSSKGFAAPLDPIQTIQTHEAVQLVNEIKAARFDSKRLIFETNHLVSGRERVWSFYLPGHLIESVRKEVFRPTIAILRTSGPTHVIIDRDRDHIKYIWDSDSVDQLVNGLHKGSLPTRWVMDYAFAAGNTPSTSEFLSRLDGWLARDPEERILVVNDVRESKKADLAKKAPLYKFVTPPQYSVHGNLARNVRIEKAGSDAGWNLVRDNGQLVVSNLGETEANVLAGVLRDLMYWAPEKAKPKSGYEFKFPIISAAETDRMFATPDPLSHIKIKRSPNGQTWDVTENGKVVVGSLGAEEAANLTRVMRTLLNWKSTTEFSF